MTKERAGKKERKRDKKVSDDKVTKSGKQKKRTELPSDTSDESSDGGAAVLVNSPEETPIAVSPEPSVKEAKRDKKTKKETQAKAEADDDTAEGGALLFSIDTNPTPINLAAVRTAVGNNGDEEQTGPKPTYSSVEMNRQARRRIKMIEKQREIIKQKKGIPEGSWEREDEVQRDLDRWTETLDRRTAVRLEKKRVRKAKGQALLRNKRGKLLSGQALKDRKKQMQKVERVARKATKRADVS